MTEHQIPSYPRPAFNPKAIVDSLRIHSLEEQVKLLEQRIVKLERAQDRGE
jgi:hypothetical protein